MKLSHLLLALLFLSQAAGATDRQTVPGHVPAVVAKAQVQPLGRLPETNQLDLAIALPLRNGKALSELIRQLYDPTSPQFRRYLTPERFTEAFGPTQQDYQTVAKFAMEHGLQVTRTHSNRLLIDVKGSVGNVEEAFHLRLQRFMHPSGAREFYAPDREPSAEMGVALLHVTGLDNYTLPRPHSFRMDRTKGAKSAGPRAGSGPLGSFTGNDFRAAYVPGTSLTGAGQVVGIFALEGYFPIDIQQYESLAGLPAVPLENVLIDGFTGMPLTTASEEVALDIELTMSMAPGLSKIMVYEGTFGNNVASTVNDILNRMATDNQAKQLSCSWGFDIDVATQQIFQEFAAQGQSFFLASGDSGAFAGSVNQPADNPFVTVVGGTSLTTDSSGGWLSEAAWNGSGGGVSTLYPLPDWQLGVDLSVNQGSSTMRNVPDVACLADNVSVFADGSLATFAGTSIAAPLWTAFTALVNEQAAKSGRGPVGFLNPALYAIGKGADWTNCFHDITTGNNTNLDSPARFSAVAGYDLCTGWGTPNGTNLINALAAPVSANFLVTPSLGFSANGAAGGPFSVTSQTYILTNTGTASLDWAVSGNSSWLEASPASGTLTPGGPATSVTVRLTAAAANLLVGEFTASIRFTDLTDGLVQNRQFKLVVGNGGFETGDFQDWNFVAQNNVNFVDSIDTSTLQGRPSLPGVDDGLFIHSGIYGAFLGQNTWNGSLSQTFSTVPGQPYTLSFWLANPATGIPNQFRVLWNGTPLYDQTDLPSFAWTNLQYAVTSPGSSGLLEFQFRNDQYAFGLDDITLQPAPHLEGGYDLTSDQPTGAVNWASLASVPISYRDQSYRASFVLLRASKGNSDANASCQFRDPAFASRATAAQAAGLNVGAYHVAAITNQATGEFYSPVSEADFFVQVAGTWIRAGNIRPCLKVEDDAPGSGCATNRSTFPGLSSWVDQWMQEVESLTGVTPILCGNAQVATALAGLASKYDLWITQPGSDPSATPRNAPWNVALIQFDNQRSVAGVEGNLGLDVFQGSSQDLQSQLIISNVRSVPTATLSVAANPSNGGTVSGGGVYPVGSQQQISATPATGWMIAGWNDGSLDNPRTVTVPAGGATYTVYFGQVPTLAVLANPPEGGTVSGGGAYPVGTLQQITASPNSGWVFNGWSDGNTDNPRTVMVTASGSTYTASFFQAAAITVIANPPDGGTVSGGGIYPVGSQQQISAVPSAGWLIAGWNDGSLDNSRTVTVPAGGAVYTVYFGQAPTLTVLANPPNGGTVSGSGTYPVGAQQQISAVANSGWIFAQWDDGNTNSPRVVTMTANDVTFTATFLPTALLTVLANPPTGGTVGGSGTYPAGTQQEIVAVATNGWGFAQWDDGNTNSSRVITMTTNDATYTATFTPTALLTVLANPPTGGIVTGSGTYPVGAQQQILAVATNGWVFAQWDDGNTNNPRVVTVAAGGTTYTAQFHLPIQPATLSVTLSTNTLTITMTGTAGGQYTVQRSEDLEAWDDVQTVTADDSGKAQAVIDTGSVPLQFFRVIHLD